MQEVRPETTKGLTDIWQSQRLESYGKERRKLAAMMISNEESQKCVILIYREEEKITRGRAKKTGKKRLNSLCVI